MRGTTITLKRSLRMRVLAASALAFVGLTAMICMVLPHAYETQTRQHFRTNALDIARGITFQLEDPTTPSGRVSVDELGSWFVAHPAMEAVIVLDAGGHVIDRWPTTAPGWAGEYPVASTVETKHHTTAFQPIVQNGESTYTVAVRFSTDELVRDLENTRWLFASIFLFTSGVFFVLAKYLSSTILNPLEQIGRAAQNLADGEPVVDVPRTGDKEIDELGAFIAKLGESRRHSRVMESPLSLLSRRAYGASASSEAGRRAPAADPGAPVEPAPVESPDDEPPVSGAG